MVKVVRRRQPQSLVAIDWSNPLTRGLTFAAIGGIPIELVRGRTLTVNGTPKKLGIPRGGVADSYTADTQYHSVAAPTSWLPGAMTIVVVADWQSGYAVPLGQMTIGGSFDGTTFVMVTGGGLDLFRGGIAYRYASSVGHSTGLHTWTARQNGGTGVAGVFTEDLSVLAGSVVNAGAPSAGTNPIRIGAHSTGVTPNYRPLLTLAFSRYLDDSEIAALDLRKGNPWQIFTPEWRAILGVSAGADANAPAAGFTWEWAFSGGAASVTANPNAPAAAFAWSWAFAGGAASTSGDTNAPGAAFVWESAFAGGAASVTANPSAPGAALAWSWAFSGGAASVPGTGTLPQVVLYIGGNMGIGTDGRPVAVIFI